MSVQPDDFGLSATKATIENAQRELAKKFDEVVRAFIESVEDRTLDLAWDLPVVAAYGKFLHIEKADFSYFVWRSPAKGPHVLAYRFMSAFHADDSNHKLTADFTLQSKVLAEAEWTDALRTALKE